jgi:hypothetical protein
MTKNFVQINIMSYPSLDGGNLATAGNAGVSMQKEDIFK